MAAGNAPRKSRREPTPEQKARAQERRAKLREMAGKIGKLTDTERAALVSDWPTTIEGHRVSLKNACLIAFQGGATVIGGFQQWRRAGRFVRKGAQSLGIFIPLGTRKIQNDSGAVQFDGEAVAFGFASVFDISQTEPAEA